MAINIGDADISCAYLGGNPVSEIYVGADKVRPVSPEEAYIDFLLIGGGGAGGGSYGGGGGAGGVIQCSNYYLTLGTYSVTIGAGGSQLLSCMSGGDGGNSEFNGLIAYGGGGGGGGTGMAGRNGGSGGGGGSTYRCVVAGGCCCTGQGNKGGSSAECRGPGGGGGAGAAGCNGTNKGPAGRGGNGIQSDISGENVWYAGGGSGADPYKGCTVSASCGGTATRQNATCCGAGSGGNNTCTAVCTGGNGIFIARYPTACKYVVDGGCKYTCGNYTIHCFTSDGTLTVN